jgi:predicted phosphoribosyltransferase/dienelactone hydrolase
VVLGLPRGGVVVAAQAARTLDAPLDVVVVRKLGTPGNPELGLGAVAEGGVVVLNEGLIERLGIRRSELESVEAAEHAELARRVGAYRPGSPMPLEGRTVILVDDGLATGYTALAAVESVRRRGAGRVVLAVPVASPEALEMLERAADAVVCLEAPGLMFGVGGSYRDFSQTGDDEVRSLLAEVIVEAGAIRLPGELWVPEDACGLVVFAHGSGSSRRSPRNRSVADYLRGRRLGTLLFDLLTDEEAGDRANVFDIGLLGERLCGAVEWVRRIRPGLGVGLFGASTGAAAALWAAAEGADVSAIVSRGGRPDLAGDRLDVVAVPTLLVVGSRDEAVLTLNRAAMTRLRGEATLEVVAGATHLFEEPGTLEQVAVLAADWFTERLAA